LQTSDSVFQNFFLSLFSIYFPQNLKKIPSKINCIVRHIYCLGIKSLNMSHQLLYLSSNLFFVLFWRIFGIHESHVLFIHSAASSKITSLQSQKSWKYS
jgi:hypothetical protein